MNYFYDGNKFQVTKDNCFFLIETSSFLQVLLLLHL